MYYISRGAGTTVKLSLSYGVVFDLGLLEYKGYELIQLLHGRSSYGRNPCPAANIASLKSLLLYLFRALLNRQLFYKRPLPQGLPLLVSGNLFAVLEK